MLKLWYDKLKTHLLTKKYTYQLLLTNQALTITVYNQQLAYNKLSEEMSAFLSAVILQHNNNLIIKQEMFSVLETHKNSKITMKVLENKDIQLKLEESIEQQ